MATIIIYLTDVEEVITLYSNNYYHAPQQIRLFFFTEDIIALITAICNNVEYATVFNIIPAPSISGRRNCFSFPKYFHQTTARNGCCLEKVRTICFHHQSTSFWVICSISAHLFKRLNLLPPRPLQGIIYFENVIFGLLCVLRPWLLSFNFFLGATPTVPLPLPRCTNPWKSIVK